MSKKAVSIVEAIVIILIITLGLTGVYNIYSRSVKMVNNMGNKIEAIQISREGIEAMTNIRDTNWLLFPSDKKHCWKTFNYDIACVGGSGSFLNKIQDTSYKIYRDDKGRWKLETQTLPIISDYKDEGYRNFFKVGLDVNGLYAQDETQIEEELLPTYTREIRVESVSAKEGDVPPFENAIKVESIVRWVDNSALNPQEVKLEVILTNYEYIPIYDYVWSAGNWGMCSRTCGGGEQTRSIVCKDEKGNIVNDSLCGGNKPETAQECNTHNCTTSGTCVGDIPTNAYKTTGNTYDRTWNGIDYIPGETTNWSYGGSICGYKCSSEYTWNSSTSTCDLIPIEYKWYTGSRGSCNTSCTSRGSRGSCSVSCGGGIQYRSCSSRSGTQTRSVYCRNSAGSQVSDSYCSSSGTKPATSTSCNGSVPAQQNQSCNTGACISHGSKEWTTPGSYTWVVPEGITQVKISAVGGGGGGGCDPDGKNTSGAGGGGGGAIKEFIIKNIKSISFTIGSGGEKGFGEGRGPRNSYSGGKDGSKTILNVTFTNNSKVTYTLTPGEGGGAGYQQLSGALNFQQYPPGNGGTAIGFPTGTNIINGSAGKNRSGQNGGAGGDSAFGVGGIAGSGNGTKGSGGGGGSRGNYDGGRGGDGYVKISW